MGEQELHNAYFYKTINDLVESMDTIKKTNLRDKILKLLLVASAVIFSYYGLNSEWLGLLELFS